MFFFLAEDGIGNFCLSRGLGDVYARQGYACVCLFCVSVCVCVCVCVCVYVVCWLLYTCDAADEILCVCLGGRRMIEKKREYDI